MYISDLSAGNYHASFSAYIAGCDEYFDKSPGPGKLTGGQIVVRVLISIVIPLIIALIFCRIQAKKMKTAVRQRAAKVYIVDGSFELTRSEDVFSHTTKTRTKIESSSSSGGSSSSSSRSSKF